MKADDSIRRHTFSDGKSLLLRGMGSGMCAHTHTFEIPERKLNIWLFHSIIS
jgi:hypothetical protein